MSANEYWNNRPSGSQQGYNQQQGYGQQQQQQSSYGQDTYPSPYGQQGSHTSHQQTNQSGWGYGSGGQQQSQSQYPAHNQAPYQSQQYSSYDQGQGYNQQQSTHDAYGDRGHSPRPPSYDPHQVAHNTYQDHGYPSQTGGQQPYPGGPGLVGAEGDRGLMGALAGGAAGGFAGHKVNHGVIGALGGAYAGHKLEDHYKDKKKDKKHGQHQGRRDSSSSSSSSSSDDEKKRRKHERKYGAAALGVGGVGAAAYAQHGRHGSRSRDHSPAALAGNFSASSNQISLDRDFDLIASCATTNGTTRLSSIDLNGCLTNSWGSLQWARGGGFGASSRNVRLVDNGRVLEAELGDGRGGWAWSRIRLDERITNNDGDLQFLD